MLLVTGFFLEKKFTARICNEAQPVKILVNNLFFPINFQIFYICSLNHVWDLTLVKFVLFMSKKLLPSLEHL